MALISPVVGRMKQSVTCLRHIAQRGRQDGKLAVYRLGACAMTVFALTTERVTIPISACFEVY